MKQMQKNYFMLVITIFFSCLHAQDDILKQKFIQAVSDNNLAKVKQLINEKNIDVDLNKQNVYVAEKTPLMIAAQHADIEMMRFLIAHGADVNAVEGREQPWMGYSVLYYAIKSGSLVAVQELIKAGANVNELTTGDLSDMHLRNVPVFVTAITENNLEILQELIKAGAQINKKSLQGNITPLMIAAHYCNPKMVQLLLDAGADNQLRDNNGKRAIDYTKEKICKKLICGCYPNLRV